MPTSYIFTVAQLAEIERLRDILALPDNAAQLSAAVPLYSYVFQCVTGMSVQAFELMPRAVAVAQLAGLPADIRSSALWLYGAIQVNSSNGAFSTVIREFNIRQGQLRGRGTFGVDLLNRASNRVGVNFSGSVLNAMLPGGTVPNPTQGRLPTVQEIGASDLDGVRDVLYPGNETPGTKLYLNQAWPGIVMLGALGGQYTDRLLRYDESQPIALNSLADIESLLLCWEAFKTAFERTLVQEGIGQTVDWLIGINLAPTLVSNALATYNTNGFDSFAQFVFSALIQNQNADARGVLNAISKIGSNRFLDMVMGANLGRALIGTTTDGDGFKTNVQGFFGALSTSQLQALGVELLPTSATGLAARALTDVNARAALGALSVISVQVGATVSDRFTLHDEATGQGEITVQWIADRSNMTAYIARSDWSNTRVYTGQPVTDNAQLLDIDSGARVLIGGVENSQRAQIVFGGTQSDVLTGAAIADRLYGGAGNDTLSGLGQADYLEGNSGDDTLIGGAGNDTLHGGADNDIYVLASGDNRDIIIDADGTGGLTWNGSALSQGLKVFNGLWQSADRQVTYTLSKNQPGPDGIERSDLVISFGGSTDRIVIRGWNEGPRNMGITFGGDFPIPQTTQNYIGDFKKKVALDAQGNTTHYFEIVDGNYVNDGVEASAPDQITGTAVSEAFYGLGGDDAILARAGDDLVFGGAGSDMLQGGQGHDRILGEDGADIIYGSSAGQLTNPARDDFTPPSPPTGSLVLNQGFNWWSTGSIIDGQISAAGYLSGHVGRDDGAGDVGNAIDAGPGVDFVAAGQGDDVVTLGDDNDMAFGMAGSDYVLAGRGNDSVMGDGPIPVDPVDGVVIYADGSRHGADVLVGDEGNDTLIGQGKDDIVFGGADNDKIWGDDRSTQNTPAEFHGNDMVFAGTGDDTVFGGARDDEIRGEIGNDQLWGDAGGLPPAAAGYFDTAQHGNDVLDGGAGDDQLVGEGGSDRLYGGDDNDWMWGDDDDVGVLPPAAHGADLLDGGAGSDLLVGNYGNDTLLGGAGNDNLEGGNDADSIVGGTGDDLLDGGEGIDVFQFSTGDGADLLRDSASDGIIRINGASRGSLSVVMASQTNIIGQSYPTLQIRYGANDRVTIDGGLARGFARIEFADGTSMSRAEVMNLVSAPLVLDGDALTSLVPQVNNALVGGRGNDTVSGGAGDDSLFGGAGDNSLSGGTGNDVYEFSLTGGKDRVTNPATDNTSTTDAVRFEAGVTAAAVSFHRLMDDLVIRAGDSASMTLTRHFTTGAQDNRVDEFRFADGTVLTATQVDALVVAGVAGAGADVLVGTAGNDTIVGLAGDDTLFGSEGNDRLDGGAGSDTYYLSSSSDFDEVIEDARDGAAGDAVLVDSSVPASQVSINSTWTGVDAISMLSVGYEGYGSDLVLQFVPVPPPGGSALYENHVRVRDFFLASSLNGSIDEVRFADGTTLSAEQLWQRVRDDWGSAPSAAADEIYGTRGADSLDALGGNDWVRGYAGDDSLGGGAGEDHVYGHAGNDTLSGGTGSDTLYGGAGSNVYLFNSGDGRDWIHARLASDVGGIETLRLGAGISASSVTLSRASYIENDHTVTSVGDITLAFGSSADSVTLGGWHQGPGYTVDRIEFADGTVWTPADVLSRLPAQQFTGPGYVAGSIQFSEGWWRAGQLIDWIPGPLGNNQVVYGTGFNDAVSGTSGDNVLKGFGGNDTLAGAAGADVLVGGAGDDVYAFSAGDGGDTLDDVQGQNVVRFDASVLPQDVGFQVVSGGTYVRYDGGSIFINGWTTTGPTAAFDRIEFADGSTLRAQSVQLVPGQGTQFNDVLSGTAQPDSLSGLAGDDYVTGQDGDDSLLGGSGNDTLFAGNGGDLLDGGAGTDALFGDAGSDTLDGGGGADVLSGGEGVDVYVVGVGGGIDSVTDSVDGGSQASIVRFGTGIAPANVAVSIEADGRWRFGTAAGDALLVTPAARPDLMPVSQVQFADGSVWHEADIATRVQAFYAAAGFQWLWGNDAANQLTGAGGNDTLFGRGGADTLLGAGGDDLLIGGAGTDSMTGGAGADSLDGGADGDTLYGGDGADQLRGEDGDDLLDAGADGGYVYGDAGADTLIGGTGNDDLIGGEGNDRYEVSGSFGRDWLVEDAGTGEVNELHFSNRLPSQMYVSRDAWNTYLIDAATTERVVLGGTWVASTGPNGGLSIDQWRITFGNGTVWTPASVLAAADLRRVSSGSDVWYGTDGNDMADASQGDDLIDGSGGNDVLHGGDGDDEMLDSSGVNLLDGGAGSDWLGVGNDWRGAGSGNAVLVGGQGDDALTLWDEQGTGYSALVLANAGEGHDEVSWDESAAGNITISVGGGLNQSQLVLRPDDRGGVVLDFSGQMQMTLGSAVQPGASRPVVLQVIQAGSILTFDMRAVLEDYRAALAANPQLTQWAAQTSLQSNALTTSSTAAIGGALAYRYAVDGSLAAMPDAAIRNLLGQAGFGAVAQNINDAPLVGTVADDLLVGTFRADVISALGGNDTLDGGAANDTMSGGAGNDTYLVDSAGDVVIETSAEGTDTVVSSVTYTLATNVENLMLSGGGSINGTGNTMANQLTGNAAANVLDGGAGGDTMTGGAGNDTYHVDSAADVIIEAASEGVDMVNASVTTTLSANVENLTLTGTSAVNGTGNALDNLLTGNSAINVLTGGTGNDTYYVTSGDTTTEAAGAGTDTVFAGVTWTLATNVENLTLTGTTAINGTGNTLDNVLTGNSAANVLTGGAGNDTYYVTSGDTTTEAASAGTDTVFAGVTWTLATNLENLTLTSTSAIDGTGNASANLIVGNSANNTLDGGAGADTLQGSAGNDTYQIDNPADVIVEALNEGIDLVNANVTTTLSANVENLTLTGTSTINGTGNALDNVLTGNSAINVLSGGAGNDTYYVTSGDTTTEASGAGTDTVFASLNWTLATNVENLTLTGTTAINGTGNALDNVLTGNSAANVLTGGTGNDTYYVTSGDTTTEAASAGTDTVLAGLTWTLATNVENLTLTGTTAINGTGNTLDNVLTGNSAANVLTGGAGNDTYYVSTGDTTTEAASAGTDSVFADVTWTLATNLENLTLTGALAINGTGNTLANVMTGNGNANTLTGGDGNDTYVGAAGNDTLNDTSSTSADVYRWGIGQGNDSVTDAGGTDRIEIGAGVTAAQVTLVRSGNNLHVTIGGATDVLTVVNWYTATANRIEEIRLADGSMINTGTAAPLSAPATAASREINQMVRIFTGPTTTDGDRGARLLVQAMAQLVNRSAETDFSQRARRPESPRFELASPL